MAGAAPVAGAKFENHNWAFNKNVRQKVKTPIAALAIIPCLAGCLIEDLQDIPQKWGSPESKPGATYYLDCETTTQLAIEIGDQQDKPYQTTRVDTPYGPVEFNLPTADLPTALTVRTNESIDYKNPDEQFTHFLYDGQLQFVIINDELTGVITSVELGCS